MTLRDWLRAEYAKAQEAARVARLANGEVRRREGPKAVGCFHVSAVARMVALGEVLERLDNDVAPRPMQTEPGA
jgi:hypothetical protein